MPLPLRVHGPPTALPALGADMEGDGAPAFDPRSRDQHGEPVQFHGASRALGLPACTSAGLVLSALLIAQSGPSNLDSRDGTPGATLHPGGLSRSSSKRWGSPAELRKEGCHGASGCAVLLAPDAPPPDAFGNLTQTLMPRRSAAARLVRLQAWVRLEPHCGSRYRGTVGRPPTTRRCGFASTSPISNWRLLRQYGNRPISSSEWKSYEISGEKSLPMRKLLVSASCSSVKRRSGSTVQR